MKTDDLLLIALGGAAAGIARRIAARTAAPMRVLVLDTDDETLQTYTPTEGVSVSIFGAKRLAGRGTGGDHRLGASALRDDDGMIQQQIGTPRLAIVLICGGGGTSGAGPHLLALLRSQGIATITVATLPLACEGDDRKHCAAVILPTLESSSDAIARIPLEQLLPEALREAPIAAAFEYAADRLAAGISLFWTLLSHPSYLAFDAARFQNFVSLGGATGLPFYFTDVSATGPDRAQTIVEKLCASPLFCADGVDRLANAAHLVVGVLAGSDLRLCELNTVMTGLRGYCTSLKDDFLGTAVLPEQEGTLTVVLLAFSSPAQDVSRALDDSLQSPALGRRTKPGRTRQSTRLGTVSSRFADMEQTIMYGENLDEPTYLRRGIRLSR